MAKNTRGRQSNNDKRNRRAKRKGSWAVGTIQRRTKRTKDKRVGTIWDPIDLTPEQIALACMQGPPKKEWDYLKKEIPPEEDGPTLL